MCQSIPLGFVSFHSFHHVQKVFKKYLGMTPSEWRQKNLKKPRPQKLSRTAGLLVLAPLLFDLTRGSVTGSAAEAEQLAATKPVPAAAPPPAAKEPAFEVKGYEITGNTLFRYADMEPIFIKHVGTNVSFETIRQALSEFQMRSSRSG
jgi:hypothetical protein